MRRTAITLVFLAVAAPAGAQEPPAAPAAPVGKPVALSDVLQVSVRQNPTLAEATIDVRVADAQLLAASGLDDWLLEGSGGVSISPVRSDVLDQSTATAIDLSASLTRPLSSGGSVGLEVDGGWSNAPSLTSGTGSRYELGAQLVASQPLLRGRGRAIARAQIAAARSAREVALRSRRAAASQVIADVINAYWELAYAARALEIERGSLQLAEERLRRIRAGIAAGATAGIEEVQVDQTAATREGEVVS
ncbi:MAG TPA: TolC family protein, partial [Kofleriaceae bacterium]|nr:TolC family protein [Kofleriaceae bacterium]